MQLPADVKLLEPSNFQAFLEQRRLVLLKRLEQHF
jgi:hypothetical protein